MPFVQRAGRRIHYQMEGRAGAPVLMFSNSLGTSLGMWDAQAAALGDSFRILRYDTLGHGRSEAAGSAATIGELARDAQAVMDAAGVERAHFVGLSLGGLTGQALALAAPASLASLTLCATAAAFPPPELWDGRIKAVLADGMAPLVETARGRWFTSAFLQARPAEAERLLDMLRGAEPAGYAACCRVLKQTDLRDQVGAITVPTLLIAGAEDLATPPAQLVELNRKIAGSELVVLPEAAHLLNVEQPAATSELIRRFALAREPRAA